MSLRLITNLLLIPRYGIFGAAIARVLSEFTLFYLAYRIAAPLVNYRSHFKEMLIPIVSAGMMGILIWPLKEYALWIPISAGILIYICFMLAAFLIFKKFRQYYTHMLLQTWPVVGETRLFDL